MSNQHDAISSEEEIEIISSESQGEAGLDQSGIPNRDQEDSVGSGRASGSLTKNPWRETDP